MIKKQISDCLGLGEKKTWIIKVHEEIFGCEGHVYFLDDDNGFREVNIFHNRSNCTLLIFAVYCASIISQ